MTDDEKTTRFASDFGQIMLQVYGELCAARERAEPDQDMVVYRRAHSTVNGCSALIVLGNEQSIERFCQEYDLHD